MAAVRVQDAKRLKEMNEVRRPTDTWAAIRCRSSRPNACAPRQEMGHPRRGITEASPRPLGLDDAVVSPVNLR